MTYNDTQWMADPTLSEITFHGVASAPSSVSADGTELPADSVTYDAVTGLLTLQTQLDMATNHRVVLQPSESASSLYRHPQERRKQGLSADMERFIM